jgi:predicted phage-related endonuclease
MQMTNLVMEVNLIQGSDDWIKHRRGCFNASELGVAMGIDKNVIRRELQRVYATGTEIEYSRYVKEVVFANGHEAEDKIRPLVASDFDTEFQPKVLMLEGLTPIPLSVSLDGLCAFGDYNLEVKQYNQELFESVKNGVVPEDRMPQLQQQLMLSPAKKTIFAISNEAMDGYIHTIVEPDEDFISRIPAIWQKFWDGVQNFTEFETFDLVPKSASEVTTPEFAINGGALSIRSNIAAWNNGILSRYNSLPVNIEIDSFPQFKETKDILDAGAKLLKIRIKELEKQAEPLLELLKQYKEIQRDLSSKASGIDNRMTEFRREQRMVHVNKASIAYADLKAKLISEIPNGFTLFSEPSLPDFYAACNRCKNHDSVASAVEAALDTANIELAEWQKNIIEKNQLINALNSDFNFDFKLINAHSALTNQGLTDQFKQQKQAQIDALELKKLREKQEQEKAEREASEKLKAEQAEARKLAQETKPDLTACSSLCSPVDEPCLITESGDCDAKAVTDKPVSETKPKLIPNRDALILVVSDSMQVDKITAEAWLLAAFKGETAESLHKQAIDSHDRAAHADRSADYNSGMATANKYYALSKALKAA